MTFTQKVTDAQLPGLYQAANRASLDAQWIYFAGLLSYLLLLVFAAFISFISADSPTGTFLSAFLFLVTLSILIGLRVKRPDDIWYNGRAVAESVKTRAWRWMMKAEPYDDYEKFEIVSKKFISDLKAILTQNRNLAAALSTNVYLDAPITEAMKIIRAMPVTDRLGLYSADRVQDQADWYARKFLFNRRRAQQWFWVSVILHMIAITMLLVRIQKPHLQLPVEVIATTASGVLTWLQAKKHNELASSYSLAAHEIVLIKGEALSIETDKQLSEFVLNAEAAFSREHTQWAARKNEEA